MVRSRFGTMNDFRNVWESLRAFGDDVERVAAEHVAADAAPIERVAADAVHIDIRAVFDMMVGPVQPHHLPFQGLRRSKAHMVTVRAGKVLKALQQQVGSHAPLIKAWNDERLRFGDRIDDGTEAARQHPNAFVPAAVLRMCYKAVGRRVETEGIDGSHCVLDVLAGAAGVMKHAQAQALESEVAMLRRFGTPFIVSRFYDATPTRVCFGKLQAELMHHARYYKHDGARWVVVPVADALKQARGNLRYGVIELMAQSSGLHYCDVDGSDVNRTVLCPPVVCQRSTASCTFRAIEDSAPSLCVPALVKAARDVPFIVYCDGPDDAKSNVLKKKYLASILPKNVLLIDEACAAHAVNRVILHAIQSYKRFVGDVHAISVVSEHVCVCACVCVCVCVCMCVWGILGSGA